jgi:hypothetical protein
VQGRDTGFELGHLVVDILDRPLQFPSLTSSLGQDASYLGSCGFDISLRVEDSCFLETNPSYAVCSMI